MTIQEQEGCRNLLCDIFEIDGEDPEIQVYESLSLVYGEEEIPAIDFAVNEALESLSQSQGRNDTYAWARRKRIIELLYGIHGYKKHSLEDAAQAIQTSLKSIRQQKQEILRKLYWFFQRKLRRPIPVDPEWVEETVLLFRQAGLPLPSLRHTNLPAGEIVGFCIVMHKSCQLLVSRFASLETKLRFSRRILERLTQENVDEIEILVEWPENKIESEGG